MSDQSDSDIQSLTSADSKQRLLEAASLVTSLIPYLGGPVSGFLSGVATDRRMNRVSEVLEQLSDDLKEFKSDTTQDYVKTEDFQELFERTMRQVAEERSKEKRRMYAAFLRDDIKAPVGTYNEKVRFLRTLEDIQPEHFPVLKALDSPPEPNPGMMGSPNQTLLKRIPGISEQHLSEFVSQLNEMKVISLTGLKTTMTGHGAADLRHSITPYGRRFLKYILEAGY